MSDLKPFDDNSIMPFGKHKGKAMANVPADHLLWLYEQDWLRDPVKTYIERNLDVLKKEIKPPAEKHRYKPG